MTLSEVGKKFTILDLNQILLWEQLLGEPVKMSKYYYAPWRADKKRGCKFVVKDQVLILMDFSYKKGYNIVNCYGKVYGMKYNEALNALIKLSGGVSKVIQKKHNIEKLEDTVKSKITIFPKDFTQQAVKYWKKYGVDISLLSDKDNPTFQLCKYSIIKKSFSYNYVHDMAFAYQHEEKYKIYFPERERPRFLGTVGKNDVWRWNCHLEKIIVAKSNKEFLVIKAMLKRLGLVFGLSMVSSESVIPEVEEWNDKFMIPFFDNDNPGIASSAKFLERYSGKSISIPISEPKDLTDYIDKYGLKKAEDLLIKLLL